MESSLQNLMLSKVFKNENSENVSPRSMDENSIKFRFGWKKMETCSFPYITRLFHGKFFKFVAVRMAESQYLAQYMQNLNADIIRQCTLVKAYVITESEAKLLNYINLKHCNKQYGHDTFTAGKDYIVYMEDIIELYEFLKVCYNKLAGIVSHSREDKFGFLQNKTGLILPYYKKNGETYVALFHFEGDMEILLHHAIRLVNWDLAFFKFCCRVQKIVGPMYAKEYDYFIRLEIIKNWIPDAEFREFWPSKLYAIDHKFLSFQKIVHLSGMWIKTPSFFEELKIEAAFEKNSPQSPPLSTHVEPPLVMPIDNNTNQIVSTEHSCSIQAQQQPICNNYSSENRNLKSSVTPQQQSGTSVNGVRNVPPLHYFHFEMQSRQQSITAHQLQNHNNCSQHPGQSYHHSTNHCVSQQQQTVNTHLSQQYDYKSTLPFANVSYQQFKYQPSNRINPRLFQHQSVTTSQSQQIAGSRGINEIGSNTCQSYSVPRTNNGLQNVRLPTGSASSMVDVSPMPSTTPPIPIISAPICDTWNIKRIPERELVPASIDANPYKIYRISIKQKSLCGINIDQYTNDEDLLVSLEGLVQKLFPRCSVKQCANILQNILKLQLFYGNSEQMNVLRHHGCLRPSSGRDVPMVRFNDVAKQWTKIENLVNRVGEQRPSKRPRLHDATAAAASSAQTAVSEDDNRTARTIGGWNRCRNVSDNDDWLNAANYDGSDSRQNPSSSSSSSPPPPLPPPPRVL